ncbi:MAG TPA: TadE/TadG family type IV pilus assembly protein [Gaiellaceae bacterium]|jgi:Flp pilus assembly protein TadG|nr:TadE/TadG family type IV pilus assembly protein [Gaiellaceae bacterium]
MPQTPHIRRDQQGQATAELAIVMPVLAMILLGVLQFGITFNHYLSLTDAVRTGARAAAVSRQLGNGASANAEAKLRAAAADLNQSKLDVSVTPSDNWAPGSTVTVSATYPYDIDVLGIVLKSGRLSSSTQERVE